MQRWAMQGWLALCAALAGGHAAAECPAAEKGAAKTAVQLERLGAANAGDEIELTRPHVRLAWLLRSCGDKASVRLPDVVVHGETGGAYRLRFVDESGQPLREQTLALGTQPQLVLLRSLDAAPLPAGQHVGLLRVQDAAGQPLLAQALRLKHKPASVPAAVAAASASVHEAAVFHRPQAVELGLRVRLTEPGASWPVLQVQALARRLSDSAAEPLPATAATARAASTPDGSLVYTLTLPDIEGPGRYDATLRLSSPGHADQAPSLVFYVRDSALVAFVFIFLGVLASYLMGRWGIDWRPRLVLRQRMSAIVGRLIAVERELAFDTEAQAIVQQALKQLQGTWEDGRARRTAPDDATLNLHADIARAFEAWPPLLKRFAGLRPETLARQLRQEVLATGTALAAPKPTADSVKTALDTLAALPQAAHARAAEALGAAIRGLGQNLGATAAPAAVAALAEARKAFDAADFDTARKAYERAVLPYTERLVSELRAKADAKQPQPAGINQHDWPTICKATQDVLATWPAAADSEARLAVLQQAARVFLDNGATALARYPKQASLSAADTAALQGHLDTLRARLEEGSVAAALQAFEDASAVAAGRGSGVQGLAAGGVSTFDALQVGDVPDAWPVFTRDGAEADARADIARNDALLSLFVLVAAAAAGIEAVWAKDLAWGGLASYAAAFFFGLASDQFTKAGITALRALKA